VGYELENVSAVCQAYTPIIGYYNQILPESLMRFIEQFPGLGTQRDIHHIAD